MIGVNKMSKRHPIIKVTIFIMLMLMTLSFIYPLYYMAINSVKTKTAYMTNPFSLPLGDLSIINYITMISQFNILNNFKNSFIIASTSVILILMFAIFASYAFAKLRFTCKRPMYLLIISTMFIPGQVTMIPMYVAFAKVGLINSYWSVILAYLASSLPGTILLMTSNFRGISDEMIEAAKIDGCNYFQTIFNLIIPMGMSAIAISIVFSFIGFWNDLFTPMIFLQKMEMRTVVVALASIMSRYSGDPPYQFAGLMLSTVPVLLVYIVFQRFIVKGLTVGSIK